MQDNRSQWAELLPLFEFAYNCSRHAQTKVTPFSIVYGANPPMPIELLTDAQVETEGPASSTYVQQKMAKLQRISALV